jgi:hypothetical protein
VNAHGALLELRDPVREGQLLSIKNMTTGEEARCTVRDISAVPGGLMEIGQELTEARSRFWRVAFPPPDWSPPQPRAKPFASQASIGSKPAKEASVSRDFLRALSPPLPVD